MKTAKKPATDADLDAPAAPPSDVPTATALKLLVVLARAMSSVAKHTESHVAKYDLTGAEFGVLEALYHKGPLLLGELQRSVLVSSGGTTFLVDRLEKRGLVERRPCATDRRARYAALTPAGRDLIRRIFPGHADAIRRALSGLGLADQRKAIQLLKTLGREAAAMGLPAN